MLYNEPSELQEQTAKHLNECKTFPWKKCPLETQRLLSRSS